MASRTLNDYEIYLFDWDGTLGDSTRVWADIIQRQFAKRGIQATERQIVARLGQWENMLELGLPVAEFETFRATCRAEAKACMHTAPLFPDADNVLQALKHKGKKLGVVTAMHGPLIEMLLHHHGYDTFFDVVVSGTDLGHQHLKPEPDGILLALERLGAVPSTSTLMLGDADRDIIAGQRAGVDSLLFFPTAHDAVYDRRMLERLSPTHIIANWSEFVGSLHNS